MMSYGTIAKVLWVFLVPVTVIQLGKLATAVLSGAPGDVIWGEFGWAAIFAFCIGMLIPATRDAVGSDRGMPLPSVAMPKRKRRRTIDVDAMLRELDAELEAMNE